MPLSRLDNFLKNVRGNILYVSPNDLDATDSIENRGNSMARPFITLQRALIEAARFSYQSGLDNDRFAKTTIILAPGEHVVDNRPGWIPISGSNFRLRDGTTSNDFPAWGPNTNFDLTNPGNQLYKLNSIHGGVIIPRGVSLVGQDLRKTTFRPLYVPNPENDNIERSALFRVTGAGYYFQFTVFDADPNTTVYKDYTTNRFVPNFSHHKLTVFEYADGANSVSINDSFMNFASSDRSDLDMYYEKVGLAYGPASGREIEPDYPSSGLDIQTKVDEYRIVGPTGGSVGITSIKAGDGITANSTITVELTSGVEGLNVDTTFQVNGVSNSTYNGSFAVSEVVAVNSDNEVTEFKYKAAGTPSDALPTVSGSSITLDTDTVTSASPYIFNVSLRSVYGLCGLHADGSKADGFKSMVVAQFTGVSLQKDDNAFVKYNSTTGTFDDGTTVDNIHSDANASYKPTYYNYHIKASNNSVCQLVSCFAIGYSQHFVTESGADFSVTNSNSNFGQNALVSKGFRSTAFSQDDVGYISHIIPPQTISNVTSNFEYGAIDVSKTVSVANTSRLYLYQETNEDSPPPTTIQGYRIGAKSDERINNLIQGTQRYARVIMPNTAYSSNEVTGKKSIVCGRSVGAGNSIVNNTLTLKEDHNFINGESIRVLSDNARLPDGLEPNKIYFAITDGVNSDQIKIASTLNDALVGTNNVINNLGGNLTIESRVSDKQCGDIGHPVQYDSGQSQWYVSVATGASDNDLYPTINALGTGTLGDATSRTFISRLSDTRTLDDRLYKVRYVIPAGSGITSARPPRQNYVLQQSNDVTGDSNTEVALQFSPSSVTMSNVTQMRNFRFIRKADWVSSTEVKYTTELPHNVSVGSLVKINNITSSNFPVAIGNSGFNGEFTVTGITSANQFVVTGGSSVDPGQFNNNVSARTTTLPTFQRLETNNSFSIYNVEEIKEYQNGLQDGIYYLTILDSSSTPVVSPFNDNSEFKFSQPVQNLYPQINRDNPVADPSRTTTYALPNVLGDTVIDDVEKSVTKEVIEKAYFDYGVGAGLTDIQRVVGGGTTDFVIHTSYDHGLNSIARVTITTTGSNYGNNTGAPENLYNATLENGATGVNATARITVNASGEITDVKIMNGGSNYNVGDVLTVRGTPTHGSFTAGTVTVAAVNSNINDTVRVSGVTSVALQDYNTVYRITGITTTNAITVQSSGPISGGSTLGIGSIVTASAQEVLTGPTLTVSSLDFTNTTGVTTVVTSQAHGLRVNNAIILGGADDSQFNGNFVVTKNISLTSFEVNTGITTLTPATTGTVRGYYPGLTAQSGIINLRDENFAGRSINVYAGITTTLSADISSKTTTSINITDLADNNLNIGDYLKIDDEIVRIKTTVGSNPVTVFRGLFGTQATTHNTGSVVKKVRISPTELRRTSITRASGHTFEYMGYGPGNYSTALPQRQLGQPTFREQLLSQSRQSAGGVNVYTGMNDRGDFFTGSNRVSSSSGKEVVYNTPIPTVTGEDIFSVTNESGIDIINPQESTVSRSLNVEGGPNQDILSSFTGPVLFTKKVNVTGDEGVETPHIFLQGDTTISRKYTVGISTPTNSGTQGDIVFNANPSKGGTAGWIFSDDNNWYEFGNISNSSDENVIVADRIAIGTDSPGDCTFRVGTGTSLFCVDENGVGIGTTLDPGSNGPKLRVAGVVSATQYFGDGSQLLNVAKDTLWRNVEPGFGTGIYPQELLSVGIGTSAVPAGYSMVVGDPNVGNTTSLLVRGNSDFLGTVEAQSVDITGIVTAADFNLQGTTGRISAGIITSSTLRIGTGGTVISALSSGTGGVGIGTTIPRALLDIEGDARFKTYHEMPVTATVSSNNVNIDLSLGQSFEVEVTEKIDEFTILNPVANSAQAFTIKFVQPATPSVVGLDTFKNASSGNIPIVWTGGISPAVTGVGTATDIYTFMSFDGCQNLFGVVTGQNFLSGMGVTAAIDGWSYNNGTQTVTIHNNLNILGEFTVGAGDSITFGSDLYVNGNIFATQDITAFHSSDERLKDNITPISDPLEKVLNLSGNTFDWNEKSIYNGKHDVGVIAQEVQSVLPEIVDERKDGTLAVDYQRIVPLLIEAVKELSQKVEDLENKLNNQ